MRELVPYISFDGNCEEAINFYKEALGGEANFRRYQGSPMESKVSDDFKNKVLHAELRAKDLC